MFITKTTKGDGVVVGVVVVVVVVVVFSSN
jgi:hypothetical protein